MKIPGLDAYTNPYVNKADETLDLQQELIKNGELPGEKKVVKEQVNIKSPEKIITSSERDFFIKMFPENSEQLSRHVLFNRNGRLQSHNLHKGSIIDGKI